MRNVLVVVNDETFINRMKVAFNQKDYQFFYTTEGSSAIAIADTNEIAVAVVGFTLPILSGIEVCETLSSINPQTQFISLFEGKDIEAVLNFYNKYHISRLVCKEEFEFEMLKSYIDDCIHMYYRREEFVKMREKFNAVSEKYLKPMSDMSELLNERLKCYEYITRIFVSCINLHINPENIVNRSFNIFIDRIVDDFIQLFLIREPDVNDFLNNLNIFYNKPDSKKYFKFVNSGADVEKNKLNVLFVLNIITICFDTFFPMYRGKIELSSADGSVEINSVYEIRYEEANRDVADKALKICKSVLDEYCDTLKFARKGELVQFKAGITGQAVEV